ncbi:MAG: TolC family protein [Armatimonadota bacterium]
MKRNRTNGAVQAARVMALGVVALTVNVLPQAAFAQQGGQTGTGGQNPGSPTTPAAPGQVSPNAGQRRNDNQGAGRPSSPSRRDDAESSAAPVGGNQSLPLADQDPSPNFDLARTVRAALGSSSSILNARRQVEIDERRVDEAEARNRPSLNAFGSATRFDAPTNISIGEGPPVTVLQDHTEQLTLSLDQQIDLLGQVRAARSQARLQQAADRAVLDLQTQERALQAKMVYFNLLRALHQVQVTEANLRSAQTQEQTARRLYEGQVGQKIDLLRASTNVAQAQQDLTAAQNRRDIARASFNDLVGRPLDAEVQAQDVPGVSVGVDIQPTGAAVGNAPQATLPAFAPFSVPTSEIGSIDVNESVRIAQGRRPEVLQSAALARAADVGIRIAREGQEPTFSLSASGNYFPTTSFQTPRQRTGALTATIRLPLYDGGLTRDRVAEARLRSEIAKTSEEASRSDVALEVRQSYLNLTTAARQIDAANAALEQAIAARQLAQVRYEGQVGLFLEVTDAQAALTRAENSQVDAVYNYLTARAQYENVLGIPALQQTNTITVSNPPAVPPITPSTATPTEAPAPAR